MTKQKITKFIQIVPGIYFGTLLYKEDYFLWPSEMMRKKGYEVEFVTLNKQNTNTIEYYNKIPIKRFATNFQILKYLLRQKNVLIHSHLRSFLPALVIGLFKKPTVHTTHNYQLGSSFFVKVITLFFFRRFTKIIALTPYEREIYLKSGISQEKVKYLPHAIDYSFFSKINRDKKLSDKLGIQKGDFILLTVANYRKFKRMDTLLKAMKILEKKNKRIKLIIVGEDRLKDEGLSTITEMVSKLKLTNVTQVGFVQPKYTKNYFSISNVLVNTSDNEAMGISVYEAAAAGIPLCLSNIGSFTTVFANLALYHNFWDSEKLAENIIFYMKNPEKAKEYSIKLKKLIKNFDFDIISKKHELFYDEIIRSA
jgi:glycosyltransferase involved in cell wall biosynthesis